MGRSIVDENIFGHDDETLEMKISEIEQASPELENGKFDKVGSKQFSLDLCKKETVWKLHHSRIIFLIGTLECNTEKECPGTELCIFDKCQGNIQFLFMDITIY